MVYDISSMAGTKAGFGFELLAAEAVSLLGGFETEEFGRSVMK